MVKEKKRMVNKRMCIVKDYSRASFETRRGTWVSRQDKLITTDGQMSSETKDHENEGRSELRRLRRIRYTDYVTIREIYVIK